MAKTSSTKEITREINRIKGAFRERGYRLRKVLKRNRWAVLKDDAIVNALYRTEQGWRLTYPNPDMEQWINEVKHATTLNQ